MFISDAGLISREHEYPGGKKRKSMDGQKLERKFAGDNTLGIVLQDNREGEEGLVV